LASKNEFLFFPLDVSNSSSDEFSMSLIIFRGGIFNRFAGNSSSVVYQMCMVLFQFSFWQLKNHLQIRTKYITKHLKLV